MSGTGGWIFLALQLMMAGALPVAAEPAEGEEKIVARVNGAAIYATELQQMMLLKRADVHRYFYQNHGVRDFSGFWDNMYNGASPAERLRREALEALTVRKVQQIVAKERGVVASIDYPTLMAAMRAENDLRERKRAEGQVVYGASRFTPQTYVSYSFDRMIEKLKAHLAQGDFKLDDADLLAFYRTQRTAEDGVSETEWLDLFEQRRGLIQMSYVDLQYQKWVDKLVEQAAVSIHQEIFEQIRVW